MAPEVHRFPLPAWLMLVPPVLVALALVVLEGYRAISPDAELFAGPPPASSLADAILHGTVEQAYAFIRDGQDPNALVTVQDASVAGGTLLHVSPLILAVAAQDANAVTMLLSAGARIDLPDNALALCLAEELEDDETREVLRRLPKATSVQCPEHVLEP